MTEDSEDGEILAPKQKSDLWPTVWGVAVMAAITTVALIFFEPL